MQTEPEKLKVVVGAGDGVTALLYPAAKKERAGITVLLGHGAGANQLSSFMREFSHGLAARGFDAMTFNFIYMEQGRHVPDQKAKLESCYRAVIAAALNHKKLKNNRGNRREVDGRANRLASRCISHREWRQVGREYFRLGISRLSSSPAWQPREITRRAPEK